MLDEARHQDSLLTLLPLRCWGSDSNGQIFMPGSKASELTPDFLSVSFFACLLLLGRVDDDRVG